MFQIEIFIFWHTYCNDLDAMGCRVTFINLILLLIFILYQLNKNFDW